MSEVLLNSLKVTEVFEDCLFKSNDARSNEEKMKDAIMVEGITFNVGFDPLSIEKNKAEINIMIDNISDEFDEGCSFSYLCMDRNENEWTSFHKNMHEIMLLGIAIGRLESLIKRENWDINRGLPYLIRKKESD